MDDDQDSNSSADEHVHPVRITITIGTGDPVVVDEEGDIREEPRMEQEQDLRADGSSPPHAGHHPVNPVGMVQPQMDAIVVVERLQRTEQYAHEVILVNDSPDSDVVEVPAQSGMPQDSRNADVVIVSPPSSKKRKRSTSVTPPKRLNYSVDDDDGSTCPICLDHWEMSGPHRLTSLKCGHLFGHSCIRRWLSECHSSSRCCPSCKTKATYRDMRHLYAKKVCAVDNTEEQRLRGLLDSEKSKNAKLLEDYSILKLELTVTKNLVSKLEGDIERLKKTGGSNETPSHSAKPLVHYKLFMEKNIEISKEPGCRVMLYGKRSGNLIVSQKSTQSLFPGFGVRFIDTKTFKPTNFLHMALKSVRDLCFDSTEDLLISATLEKTAKLFNVRDRNVVSSFTPSDKPLWACALDKEISNFLYLGSQHGSTYVYDVRYPSTIVEEFKNEGDLSPVINICPVSTSNAFPFGGFLVCKLQSIWFYEKLATQEIVPIRLCVEGPFVSMSYESTNNNVLISTRPSSKHIHSRYIVGSLKKANEMVILDTAVTFFGSKVLPVMSRCTQIPVRENTLVAAYLQDVKLLSMWDLRESCRIQSLPIADVVYDTCPVYDRENAYLAALTETKCRIYKVITSE